MKFSFFTRSQRILSMAFAHGSIVAHKSYEKNSNDEGNEKYNPYLSFRKFNSTHKKFPKAITAKLKIILLSVCNNLYC